MDALSNRISRETRVMSADFSWKSAENWRNNDLNKIYVDIRVKWTKKALTFMTVFENARIDGAKNKIAREMDKPEIQELLERKKWLK